MAVETYVDSYASSNQATDSPAIDVGLLGTVKSWIRRGLISLKECLS